LLELYEQAKCANNILISIRLLLQLRKIMITIHSA
jgi:hypothetical protein